MNKIFVDYDLNSTGQNYPALIAKLNSYNSARICKSSWVIKTPLLDTQIRDELFPYIDGNDRLFVAVLSNWAASGIPKELADWLNRD